MKRLLLALLSVFAVVAVAVAQTSSRSILLDEASFRPVQTDALSGIAIDKIGLDRSKRPCVRLKMRINRMTSTEVAELEVRFRGGVIDLVKQQVAHEGNGLIVEMTAHANTRFYLHHERFGDSNEVQISTEGNKEYYIEASLNQFYPITVASNVVDAEVYIDGQFKGKISSDYVLTISEVLPGEHTLRVVYGSASHEQQINVNSTSAYFRQEIDIESARPQYVVFQVTPATAVVMIDGEPYAPQQGVVTAVLQNGTYNYRVVAKDYHEESGTFTVAGKKVEREVVLRANLVKVSLSTDEGCEIWINNRLYATTSWEGMLGAGSYFFEARKQGFRPSVLSQIVAAAPAEQSYTIPAPKPITGSLDISSTPALANITIDGNKVGRTPMVVGDLLVGQHEVVVEKEGYATRRLNVTVSEGEPQRLKLDLVEGEASQSVVAKVYRVGDYYDEDGRQGVVFEVDATGTKGKIVSLVQSSERLMWANNEDNQKVYLSAASKSDGRCNMRMVQLIGGADWYRKYPAFTNGIDIGRGWYLPAIDELKLFTLNDKVRDAVNATLRAKGATPIYERGELGYYWSSSEWNTEKKDDYKDGYAAYVDMERGSYHGWSKTKYFYTRAVATFGEDTVGPYKVGDYFNEAGCEGVVVEVDVTGYRGKIISLTGVSTYICTDYLGYNKSLYNHSSTTDGRENCKDHKGDVPAMDWCRSLGDGWYLPAIDEMKCYLLNDPIHDKVNHTLKSMGGCLLLQSKGSGARYWSSTAGRYSADKSKYCSNHDVGEDNNNNSANVRAMRRFEAKLYDTPTVGPYKVGDYYNEGGRKGVVFAVDATGLHGKIVALDDCAAQTTTWTSDKRLRKVSLSATDRADGAKNQAAVEQVADWQTKYPPFARCASLGKGWYLPAVDEVAPLCREGEVRNVVGAMLSLRGKALDGLYHTSTEAGVGLVYNSAGEQVSKFAPEDGAFMVRAVSTF